MIRMRKRAPYRDSRPPEIIRRKRRIRRARNLLFLIIFLGMFGLGFNRVIAYEKMLFWLLLGIAGIVLAMFPLSALTLDMFDIYGTTRPFRGQDVVFFDLCAMVGIAIAIAIQYFWRPFGFIHVLLVDYVSGYFFFTAVVLVLLVCGCACAVSLHCTRYGAYTHISPGNKTNSSGCSALVFSLYYTWSTCHVCLAAFHIHTTTSVAFCLSVSAHLAAISVG